MAAAAASSGIAMVLLLKANQFALGGYSIGALKAGEPSLFALAGWERLVHFRADAARLLGRGRGAGGC
jgi:hypothetical protein